MCLTWQWDTVASQLLEKLQRLAVEEFGGIVRSGSKLSHSDSSTEAFEISPENMQKLRQRQMEIKIGDRLRDVLRHVRGLNVRPKFDRGPLLTVPHSLYTSRCLRGSPACTCAHFRVSFPPSSAILREDK